MSVTRYINAGKATQVNSNLIGVGVHPEVGTINMNYPWRYCETTAVNANPGTFVISVLFTGDTEPYAYTAVAEAGKPDGITIGILGPTYYNYRFYTTPARQRKRSIWLNNPRGADITDTNVYELTSEEVEGETVYTATVIGTVQGYSIGSAGDTFTQKAGYFLEVENNVFINLNDEGSGFSIDLNNWYVYDINNNVYGVSKLGVRYMSLVTLSAERQSVSSWEGKFEWKGTPMRNGQPVSENYQNISVWTDVENPGVGDLVYYTKNNTEFNVMAVTSTEPVAVSCSVSYSVDGVTFTDVEDTLTDANNVIANVPRYVYLKFSQDVEITEE